MTLAEFMNSENYNKYLDKLDGSLPLMKIDRAEEPHKVVIELFLLSGINTKQPFKTLTVNVKPVSNPAAFSQYPFKVMAGGRLLFLPFGA